MQPRAGSGRCRCCAPVPAARRSASGAGRTATTPSWTARAAPRPGGPWDRRAVLGEVPKSRRAADQVRRALDEGPHAVLAWGGDGLVRRCIGVLAGSVARLAGIPGAHAFLFAP